jgi:hypothetical protein
MSTTTGKPREGMTVQQLIVELQSLMRHRPAVRNWHVNASMFVQEEDGIFMDILAPIANVSAFSDGGMHWVELRTLQ